MQLHLFQRYDMLFVVFFLADHYVAVDKYVVEQEKLSGLWSFAAHFGQNALANQHTAQDLQRL